MKYKIIPSKRFEKDMKRCQKRGYNILHTGIYSQIPYILKY